MPTATSSYQYYPVSPKPYRLNIMNRPPPPILDSVDLATWSDGDWAEYTEGEPEVVDQPWPYRFRSGEAVWARGSDGYWYRGKVVSPAMQGKTRSDHGLFWCVEYQVSKNRVRKWFAPLNGEIKPDIPRTRELLRIVGWLAADDL